MKKEITWDEFSDEFKKAEYRLRGDPRQSQASRYGNVMEWVIRFAQLDLASLSTGDWNNLRYEIICFTKLGKMGDDTIDDTINDKIDIKTLANWPVTESDVPVSLAKHFPAKDVVAGLQKTVLTHIIQLLEVGRTTFSMAEIGISVSKIMYQMKSSHKTLDRELTTEIKYDKVEEIKSGGFLYTKYATDCGHKIISAKTPVTVFEYYLVDMLTTFAPLISRCPECKTIFLASRSNQQFCSTRCLSRLSMRKYRNTPPERIGKPGRPARDR